MCRDRPVEIIDQARRNDPPISAPDIHLSQRSCLFAGLVIAGAFVVSSCSRPNEEAEVNASAQRLVAAVNAKDINGIMAYYTPDDSLLVFDALIPRQYVGAAAFRKDWEGFLATYPGALHAEVSLVARHFLGHFLAVTVISIRPGPTSLETTTVVRVGLGSVK